MTALATLLAMVPWRWPGTVPRCGSPWASPWVPDLSTFLTRSLPVAYNTRGAGGIGVGRVMPVR